MAAFYARLLCLFYSSTGPVRWDRLLIFFRAQRIRSEVKKVVHWMPEILFAAEIAFRGLDRCMSQQKLNLLQFTTTVVT